MTHRLRQRAAVGGLMVALVAGPAEAQLSVDKYVAIGDSLTAGFSSGGLSIEQQADSYPALIYRSFELIGDPLQPFEQPLVSAPGLPPQLALQGLFPTVIAPRSNQPGQPANLTLARPYDNLGVPGARMHDPANTVTGGAHDLVLRGAGTALQQALAQSPTVITIHIGNNDVLGAATSGIVIDGVTLTPIASFEADLRFLVNAVADGVRKVAVANLPDVTSVPFLTTIPPVVVNPQNNQPVLGPDGRPIPLIGPGGSPLTPNDHVLLTASAELAQGRGIPAQLGGSGQPLSNGVVLDAAETAMVQTRVAALNEIIAAVAAEHEAALVDVNGLFDGIVNNGLSLGGVHFSAAFLTGGIFSYDGVHPTRLGYGVLANAFIRAMNESFEDSVPLVDLVPLAFEPPASETPEDAGIHLNSADSRWTDFIYTRKAWNNLRYALGIDSAVTATPGTPAFPTLPNRPERGRPLLTNASAPPSGAASARPGHSLRGTPGTTRQVVQRRTAEPR